MQIIKLVIWDLDDTFWKGTLSEGDIEAVISNINIVKELTGRGIINSISSKNDYQNAKIKLSELGIWDYFVFPIINWNPKGENVKTIIYNCQLRNENVLFIDDNIQNLKEVEYYNKGINILNSLEINTILSLPALKGKNDIDLSRLQQYKILEQKKEFKSKCSDNISFLIQSEIKMSFIYELSTHKERILELIGRTNQLNFTKVRISSEQLDNLLNDNSYQCAAVKIVDKFGDYGICGFYALKKSERKLKHFLFSCRILNLGVEDYVYTKLDQPEIDIVQPVSSTLDQKREINWIAEFDVTNEMNINFSSNKRTRLLFVGGCDLEQLCHYIDKNKFEILTDFNYPNQRGISVHREHTIYLKQFYSLSIEDLQEISNLPFGDNDFFNMKIFSEEYDVLIYSVLMNYTHSIYRHKYKNIKVSCGGYSNMEDMYQRLGFSEDEINYFGDNYEYVGLQKPAEFIKDLEWLLSVINKPIIFLNGAEIRDCNVNEPESFKRHCEMNKVLDEFIKEYNDRCMLVDIRDLVKNKKDIRDSIRHYQRIVYVDIAEKLMNCITNSKVRISNYKKNIIRISLIKQAFADIVYKYYSLLKKK